MRLSAFNQISKVKLVFVMVMVVMGLITVILAYHRGGQVAADDIRVRDIGSIQTFLQSYKRDYGKYPLSFAGLPEKVSEYMDAYPKAPAPSDNCQKFAGDYVYSQLSGGADYKLEFCLGSDTGQFHQGSNIVQP